MRRIAPLAPSGLALGVLLGVAGLWWVGRADRRRAERQVARAVAAEASSQVRLQAAVVAELADRFGRWEGLPEAALGDALRAVGTRHPRLTRLLVADRAGRILAIWDAAQPLGQEGDAAGRLDDVLGRRHVLEKRQALAVGTESQAGRLTGLWVAAAILRPDGSRPGYVAGSLDLPALRRDLLGLVPTATRLHVASRGGARLLPCKDADPAGARIVGERFRVAVALPWRPAWPWLLLGLLGGALLLVHSLSRLRRRQPPRQKALEYETTGREPYDPEPPPEGLPGREAPVPPSIDRSGAP